MLFRSDFLGINRILIAGHGRRYVVRVGGLYGEQGFCGLMHWRGFIKTRQPAGQLAESQARRPGAGVGLFLWLIEFRHDRRVVAGTLVFAWQLVDQAAFDGWLECIAHQDVINAQATIPAKCELPVVPPRVGLFRLFEQAECIVQTQPQQRLQVL